MTWCSPVKAAVEEECTGAACQQINDTMFN